MLLHGKLESSLSRWRPKSRTTAAGWITDEQTLIVIERAQISNADRNVLDHGAFVRPVTVLVVYSTKQPD